MSIQSTDNLSEQSKDFYEAIVHAEMTLVKFQD